VENLKVQRSHLAWKSVVRPHETNELLGGAHFVLVGRARGTQDAVNFHFHVS